MKTFFKIIGFLVAAALVLPLVFLVYLYLTDKDFSDSLKKSKESVKRNIKNESKNVKKEVQKAASKKVEEVKSNLSPRQKEMLELVQKNVETGMSELSKQFKDVTPRTLRRDLTDLVEKGLIEKMGSTKSTSYKARG